MLLKYKIILVAITLLLSFGSGSWVTYKFMLPKVEAERVAKENCQEANKKNSEVIIFLENEIVKGNKSCTNRLKEKDKTIKKLQDVDNLNGGEYVSDSTGTNNIILNELNRMFLDM